MSGPPDAILVRHARAATGRAVWAGGGPDRAVPGTRRLARRPGGGRRGLVDRRRSPTAANADVGSDQAQVGQIASRIAQDGAAAQALVASYNLAQAHEARW